MRIRTAVVVVFVTALSAMLVGGPSPCAAQGKCKPDVSQVDKVSNKRIELYSQQLFATSFMASMWKAQETYITLDFVQVGDEYAVQLRVQKKEGSVDRAVFESQYRGAVGQPIQFGFKSGDPLEIVVSNVANNSQMSGFLSDSRRVSTTVVLAAELRGDDLERAREAFTTRQVQAVRVHLAGSVGLTKDVDDKLGRQLMQKAGCFFDRIPIAGPGSADPAVQTGAAAGKYMFKKGNGSAGDFTELANDGTFSLSEGGRVVTGTYKIQGEELTLQIPNGPRFKAKLVGNSIMQPDGTVLEKSDRDLGTPPVGNAGITLEQIIQMVSAKIPDDVIISSIEKSGGKFNLTPMDMIKLKEAGVSDAVLRVMAR